MFFLIKFIFYFSLSFFILCIPTGDNKHLFDLIYTKVTPYTEKIIKNTKQKISTTKKYSKKLYSNSDPIEKDEVKTKSSSIKKKITIKKNNPDDFYTEEERDRLKKALSEDSN